jgi:hypothetical protein
MGRLLRTCGRSYPGEAMNSTTGVLSELVRAADRLDSDRQIQTLPLLRAIGGSGSVL